MMTSSAYPSPRFLNHGVLSLTSTSLSLQFSTPKRAALSRPKQSSKRRRTAINSSLDGKTRVSTIPEEDEEEQQRTDASEEESDAEDARSHGAGSRGSAYARGSSTARGSEGEHGQLRRVSMFLIKY